MSSTLSGQWLRLHARQCSVTPHKKRRNSFYDRTLRTSYSTAADEWESYSPDFNHLDYCIWDILQDLVYEGRRLPFASLQNLKEVIVNNWKEVTIQVVRKSIAQWKQKLSYRQQIARLLRTQYAAGIYRHTYYIVTLKCRLRVTRGHWKRNHWIDHTRLSSSRVIWR